MNWDLLAKYVILNIREKIRQVILILIWLLFQGQLCLPHGVTYDGEFDQGRFHGKGILTYPSGVSVEGIWDKGRNLFINWIRFADGLKYMHPNWTYMSPPERR